MKIKLIVQVFRNLLKNKISMIINLFGLSIGIAVFLLISLYLHNELTADRFHKNLDNIYRLGATDFNGTVDMPAPLADMILDRVPDVEKISRIDFTKSWMMYLKYENQSYNTKNILFADSTFFEIFSFESVIGDLKTALSKPGSVVLTKSLSQKIFGSVNPINEQLFLQNEVPVTITAIVEDVPGNSSINFNGIVSFETLKSLGIDYSKEWGNFNYETYCLIRNSSISEVETKINDEFKKAQPQQDKTKFSIHPFKGLYLNPNYSDGSLKHGNLQTVFFLFISAILIIVLAVINFVNLNLSSISQRIKSLSIQKIIGAQKKHIFYLLFHETFVIFLLSGIIGLLVTKASLPFLNNLMSVSLKFSFLLSINSILIIVGGIALLSLISAYLPFAVVNKQKVQLALKGQALLGNNKTKSRQVLIAIQFIITIILIISSLFINKQLIYINSKDLGFEKENTFLVFLEEDPEKNYELLKNGLSQYPQFNQISLSHSTPGTIGMQWGDEISFKGEKKRVSYYSVPVTPGYLEMMGYQLKTGRFFNDSLVSDRGACILNEAAVKEYGISEAPLQAKFSNYGKDAGKIIGVVKDFHFQSLHEKIKPLVFNYIPGNDCSLVSIKSKSGNFHENKELIKTEYNKILPEIPFQCFTIDNLLSENYIKETNLNRIITFFSFLSILIGCLGLLGIVNVSVVSRIKEIGIRKVNGAKVSEVLAMLNKDFVKWVAIAFVIACPIAYYAMSKWLENFAYKTTLSWWVFALAGVLALGIALLTVSFQSYKAAIRNPIESLRYE